jgi:hypothetical protein
MAITVNGTSGITFPDTVLQGAAFTGSRGQVFTSSGTFTIPAGVSAVKVTVVGGGGGGGSMYDTGNAGSGGGAGGACIKYLTGLTSGNTLSVTIGAGGAGGIGAQGFGGAVPVAGGTTTVSSGTQSITTLSATGGDRGGNTYNSDFNRITNGGVGTNGDLNINGGTFRPAYLTYGDGAGGIIANRVAYPRGGASYLSEAQPPTPAATAITGTASVLGAGGSCLSPTAGDGTFGRSGAGGSGCVIFEW